MKYFRFFGSSGRDEPESPERTAIKSIVERLLSRLFPLANPDFHDEYRSVVEWWLEIDDEGQVTREIGFDEKGRPIVGAPIGDNLGVFTDEVEAPASLNGSIAAADFDLAWKKFVLGYTRV